MKTLIIILISSSIIFISSQAQDIGLQITSDHNVLFGDSITAAGSKMMWIPSKGSLMAGFINNKQWDPDSIGYYSAVFGYRNKNLGKYNIVSGLDNQIAEYVYYSSIAGSSNILEMEANWSHVRGRFNFIGLESSFANVQGHSNIVERETAYANVMGLKNRIATNVKYASVMGVENIALSVHEHIIGKFADTTQLAGSPAHRWEGTQQLFSIGNGNSVTERNNALTVLKNGRVALGTKVFNADHELTVNGSIYCDSISAGINNWPDFVFEPDYKLLPLQDVKNYIDHNGHLPQVPKAQEIEKNGINLGEMNRLLMQKVEELTLYIINQEERIQKLEEMSE